MCGKNMFQLLFFAHTQGTKIGLVLCKPYKNVQALWIVVTPMSLMYLYSNFKETMSILWYHPLAGDVYEIDIEMTVINRKCCMISI